MPQFALIEGQVSTAPSYPSFSAVPLHPSSPPIIPTPSPTYSLPPPTPTHRPPHTHKPHPFKPRQTPHLHRIPSLPSPSHISSENQPAKSPPLPLPPPTHKAGTHLTFHSYITPLYPRSAHPCKIYPAKYPECSMLMMGLWDRRGVREGGVCVSLSSRGRGERGEGRRGEQWG